MKFELNFYKISIVLSEITHFKINFELSVGYLLL